ncbi:uncharacterized protein LOC118433230 isoform X1 [Folsomia candida]|uniref:uncharacterized protein LOC118433230 isoform X1 n=1 Tax=Folsomia candida TaxID=158441 RepID=UPI001604FB98|nr:uncharacterized protein LOC118433230 isoform X1 [Folsomia candida]
MAVTGNVIGFLLVLVNYLGILCSSYFFMLSILSFLMGLKGMQINGRTTNVENTETKITNRLNTDWINFLISFTSASMTTFLLVLWIYLNRKLRGFKCCKGPVFEHDYAGYGAAYGLDERSEKLRRLGRYLQVYYIIKH